jgi:CPA1 family monovalent cation:H+ antiporter
VATGLVLGRAQHLATGPHTRIAARAILDFVEFTLNSLVFILIGLQLNHILDRLAGRDWRELAVFALAVAAALILSRFVWIFPATWLPRLIPAIRRRDPWPGWRHVAVLSWSGMRGVVSLAAALALPVGFPERDVIIFLAFIAILATLVVQGTTLEWLILRLGVARPAPAGGIDPEEAEGRRLAADAALAEIEGRLQDLSEGAIAAGLVEEYRSRAAHHQRQAAHHGEAAMERVSRRRLQLAALEASRRRLLGQHAKEQLGEEGLVRLMQELDVEELRVRRVLGDERTRAERAAETRVRRTCGLGLLSALPPHR